jgi:surface antigen
LRTLIEPIREALFPSELRLTGAVSGLAFSALFLAGGVTGWVLGQAVAPGAQSGALVMLDGGGLVAAASLRQALETAPSGEAAAQTGAGSSDAIITPLLSFASHDQRYCRQYEISLAAGRSFAGVACRSPDAVWHVAFHAEVEGGKPTQGQRYETASRSGSPALEAVIDTMIKDSALGPDDETALLANGWGSGKE